MSKKLISSDAPFVVRGGGGIVAETRKAIILVEEGQRDRVFFPRRDVAMVLFDASDTKASDVALGKAKYYSLAGKSNVITDVAWSYEAADGDFADLADYLTFDSNKVAVEEL